ncbi:MAG: hypothetical protein O3C34_07170 [Proteobacteria bacterium]|nr:hypothetical protein [Pseudomonadota bacterium]
MARAARQVGADPVRLLAFAYIDKPVALIGCDELSPLMRQVLRGWGMTETVVAECPQTDIVIRRTKKGYSRSSPWLAHSISFQNPVNAVCDFLVDLTNAYLADNPQFLCLHAAAVLLDDGLALFPGIYRAGKSTLSVHCAAAGFRLFADDVLPVDGKTKEGIAPGILPRLRLPLPDNSDAAFTDFVGRHEGPRSDRYLYVDPEPDRFAPRGTRAPITAIVLLERIDTGAPEIAEISSSETLKRAIQQNFSRALPALDILDHLQDIVSNARCFELQYRTGEEAVDLLRRRVQGKA